MRAEAHLDERMMVQQRAVDPRPLTNTLIMGMGFFFIKGGFIPVQSFASSLLNFTCIPMGTISIGLVSPCAFHFHAPADMRALSCASVA